MSVDLVALIISWNDLMFHYPIPYQGNDIPLSQANIYIYMDYSVTGLFFFLAIMYFINHVMNGCEFYFNVTVLVSANI